MKIAQIKQKHVPVVFLLVFLLSPLVFYLGYRISAQMGVYLPKSQIVPTKAVVPVYTPFPTPDPEWFEQRARELINQHRVSKGLKPLKENALLHQSAELKLQDINQNDYWAHVSPDGVEPRFFIKKAGYKYQYAGENLGRDFATPESLVEAWLTNPEHRKNIETKSFTEDGLAVAYKGYLVHTAVHHFGTASTAQPSPKAYDPNATKEISRTGKIIPYHEWCSGKDISVYENELITRKSSDGNIYSMTQGDWDCYEKLR